MRTLLHYDLPCRLEFWSCNRYAQTGLVHSGKEIDQRLPLQSLRTLLFSTTPSKIQRHDVLGVPFLSSHLRHRLSPRTCCRSFCHSWSQRVGVPLLNTAVGIPHTSTRQGSGHRGTPTSVTCCTKDERLWDLWPGWLYVTWGPDTFCTLLFVYANIRWYT